MEYFVVIRSFGALGLEAVADPDLTRDQIIQLIKTREYDNIIRIDHIKGGKATEVTGELIDAAEELQESESA